MPIIAASISLHTIGGADLIQLQLCFTYVMWALPLDKHARFVIAATRFGRLTACLCLPLLVVIQQDRHVSSSLRAKGGSIVEAAGMVSQRWWRPNIQLPVLVNTPYALPNLPAG